MRLTLNPLPANHDNNHLYSIVLAINSLLLVNVHFRYQIKQMSNF